MVFGIKFRRDSRIVLTRKEYDSAVASNSAALAGLEERYQGLLVERYAQIALMAPKLVEGKRVDITPQERVCGEAVLLETGEKILQVLDKQRILNRRSFELEHNVRVVEGDYSGRRGLKMPEDKTRFKGYLMGRIERARENGQLIPDERLIRYVQVLKWYSERTREQARVEWAGGMLKAAS